MKGPKSRMENTLMSRDMEGIHGRGLQPTSHSR